MHNKITVRNCNSIQDIEELKPLIIELHSASHFSNTTLDLGKCHKILAQSLKNPRQHALMLCELEGVPIGFIFCSVGEILTGNGALFTSVGAFYVGEKYRHSLVGGRAAVRLLAALIEWSKQRNAREIMIHVTSGIDIQRTDKFLRRARFRVIGANYAFALGESDKHSGGNG